MWLNHALVEALTGAEPQTLGEAVHHALGEYAQQGHFPNMLRIYNILGDPAARLQ